MLHYSDKTTRNYNSNSTGPSPLPSSGYHRVQTGETLFSIAFRYGLDYRELAKSNNIDSTYVIYPQQKIHLVGQKKSASGGTQKASVKTSSSTSVAKSTSSKSAPKKLAKSTKKPSVIDTKDDKPVSRWAWPVVGQVTKGFSNAGVSSKGIDIKASQGALVKAAADGTVVYAGSGLIGYGNLVIVKHNDIYLSAYAYNDSILVKEQQNVKAGDSLAVIGGKGNNRPLLHFEVRRDGRPINPLEVLPKKR